MRWNLAPWRLWLRAVGGHAAAIGAALLFVAIVAGTLYIVVAIAIGLGSWLGLAFVAYWLLRGVSRSR
jgi:hypothetical protein